MKAKTVKVLLALAMAVILQSSFAQDAANVVPDSRLYQSFDSSYVLQLQKDNPMLIVYYNYYLDNAYYSVELPGPKPITGDDIHTIKLSKELSKGSEIYFKETVFNSDNFNPLNYDFKTQDSNWTTYIWEEAGVALVFLPRKKVSENYQNYLKKNNIQ